ncbi:MAG: RraA family protein [Planctomycetales bacterium]|nr:RraA family protein [Planctomycetales bacterium]
MDQFQEMRERLYSAVVSDALDSLGFHSQSPRIALTPMTCPSLVLVGRCKTTLWEDIYTEDPNPYELELLAVDQCQPGDVFIAAANGSTRSGIWGELLTTASLNSGCAGVITDGAVRDVAAIDEIGFPVFAAGTSVYDSLHRQRVVKIDVPVTIGEVEFCPKDLVIADRDGIVVVPAPVEEEAIRRAFEKVDGENRTRDAIRNGMKATDAYKKYGVL